ncbi:MAG: type IV toxin-antitoxin system AbiEi family antitoxin domain-containing protein [Solirubrobacterales bacterium]
MAQKVGHPRPIRVSETDRQIAELAARQHSIIDVHDLRTLGVSASAVKRRVADLRLRRLHRGVYAVGQLNQRGRWLAAVRAIGAGAVLSHRDAAALHGLTRCDRRAVEVTIPRRVRSRPGIAVHHTRALHPSDRTSVADIPVTSAPRTLLDLSEVVDGTRLRRAYEEAERLRVLDVGAVEELLARSNGRHSVSALRALLGYDPAPTAEAKSELETRFMDLIRENGLPLPQLNVLVEGYLVDAYWPDARLVVELQSYGYHSQRTAFERDHAKLARLKLGGCETLALTWRQVTSEQGETVALVRMLLTRTATRRTI